jgi:hypothetical protein
MKRESVDFTLHTPHQTQAAYERCGLPLAWGERFWGALMDKLPSAKAVKVGGLGSF